ncbi:MAG TPA: DUF1819 family protein, partial [Bacillota bacterium]|nr:DUF1819 family protein [Bacillota bacterium]
MGKNKTVTNAAYDQQLRNSTNSPGPNKVSAMPYNGTLTAEQFLFYEMRIVSKQYIEGKSIDEIIEYIKSDNLFQYPTERMVMRMARACYKRIIALENEKLVYEVANAPL